MKKRVFRAIEEDKKMEKRLRKVGRETAAKFINEPGNKLGIRIKNKPDILRNNSVDKNKKAN